MKGLFFDTNKCGKLEVISEIKNKHVLVRFCETGYETLARVDSVRNGSVKDRLFRSVHGVGFIGDGVHETSFMGKNTIEYLCWQRMIGRCYDRNNISHEYYKDCIVCDEWHNYQNFADWHKENYPNDGNKYALDKDIIVNGNRVYGPDFCKFVSTGDNTQKSHSKHYRAISPNGDVIEIYNLSKFCRENGLNKSNMQKVLTGKDNYNSCKGWRKA